MIFITGNYCTHVTYALEIHHVYLFCYAVGLKRRQRQRNCGEIYLLYLRLNGRLAFKRKA